ncbi:MAG: hypothetical protein U0838_13810 [Chloroflexota bacterium]
MDRESGGSVDPRRAYRVEVSGVGGPRNRSGRAAAAALVTLVALVVGGLVSGQLFPVQQAVAPAPSSSAVAIASATASPAPTPTPILIPDAPLTPRVTGWPVDIAALVAAIPEQGAGPLAFVAGRLHSTAHPCEPEAPLSECRTLRIDGLRAVEVVPDDAMRTWPGDPVLGETLVLLPRDGKLVYLGSLLVGASGIPRIDVLSATIRSSTASSGQLVPSLHEADGILARGIAPCMWQDRCPAGAAVLLPMAPPAGAAIDSTVAETVTVADSAFGVRPADTWTAGPFLLRIRTDLGPSCAWELAAIEDQGSVLHVVIP